MFTSKVDRHKRNALRWHLHWYMMILIYKCISLFVSQIKEKSFIIDHLSLYKSRVRKMIYCVEFRLSSSHLVIKSSSRTCTDMFHQCYITLDVCISVSTCNVSFLIHFRCLLLHCHFVICGFSVQSPENNRIFQLKILWYLTKKRRMWLPFAISADILIKMFSFTNSFP